MGATASVVHAEDAPSPPLTSKNKYMISKVFPTITRLESEATIPQLDQVVSEQPEEPQQAEQIAKLQELVDDYEAQLTDMRSEFGKLMEMYQFKLTKELDTEIELAELKFHFAQKVAEEEVVYESLQECKKHVAALEKRELEANDKIEALEAQLLSTNNQQEDRIQRYAPDLISPDAFQSTRQRYENELLHTQKRELEDQLQLKNRLIMDLSMQISNMSSWSDGE